MREKKINHKCQVTLHTDRRLEYDKCNRKAIVKIKDIVCKGLHEPFWVCKKHKDEFLKTDHYKECI